MPDLRSNALIELPDDLCELKNLRKLDLRWNMLSRSPQCLAKLAERGCLVYT